MRGAPVSGARSGKLRWLREAVTGIRAAETRCWRSSTGFRKRHKMSRTVSGHDPSRAGGGAAVHAGSYVTPSASANSSRNWSSAAVIGSPLKPRGPVRTA
jgi:hypothetical protein